MRNLWQDLPVLAQDVAILIGLLLPLAGVGLIVLRGYRPWALLAGLFRRTWGVSLIFVLLIAVSVALGTGIIAQERGLRMGSAQAASKFDLIVAAPGSELTTMLAAVFLQPSDVELIDGQTYARIETHPRVALAAPIAFGDSWQGHPVVGTTGEFVEHLTEGLETGRMFATMEEAVAGARVPIMIGEGFIPAHGLGDAAVEGAHGDLTYTVVGRMPYTGSPWDKAILVAVESVWDVHGLANGHGPDWDGTLGGPFVPEAFPGTPAALVRADALWATYQLQAEFSTSETMAFFPGAVLSRLYNVLGDVRSIMSILAGVTQILVAAGVLAGLFILMRLLARRLALLRALGAPARFIFGLVWLYAASLITMGALLGLLLGLAVTGYASQIITERTDVLVEAQLGWLELHLVAGFVSLSVLLALVPAALSLRRSPVEDLRAN